MDELINRSAAVSARSFRFPVEHGVEVERLATELFDAVRRRFDWGPEERYAVRAAALHHDIGTTVASWHHALHSAYILRHTPLLGLTHRVRGAGGPGGRPPRGRAVAGGMAAVLADGPQR